jgi:heterodisulfide reductase subunit A-like polyferredoxin
MKALICTRKLHQTNTSDIGRMRVVIVGCIGTRPQEPGYRFRDTDCCVESFCVDNKKRENAEPIELVIDLALVSASDWYRQEIPWP